MKKIYYRPKRSFFVILLGTVFLLIAIINSCKKEEKQTRQDLARENLISQAKDWYQKTYPVTVDKSSLKTQGSGSSDSNDFSQVLKPDWGKAATYNRLNSDVIEMPLDSATKLALVDNKVNVYSFDFKRSYSKSSFLILNNGSNYSAYIMTIVADSSYLKNDFSRLSNNTYRKHDKDFSGYLLYYTPKGVFVSGLHYLNGQINKTISLNPIPSTGLKPESIKALGLKTMGCQMISWTTLIVASVQGYITDYIYTIWSVEICDEMGRVPNPADGGFGDPSGSSTTNTVQTIITNKIADSCLHAMVGDIVNKDIKFNVKETLNSIFNSNNDFNLDFRDSVLATNIDGVTDLISGNTQFGALNIRIALNSSTLPNASKEFIAATILHEALHAYFRYNNATFDHQVMSTNYIGWFESAMKNMFPTLSDYDNESLAWGGLYSTFEWSQKDSSSKNFMININNSYKAGTTGNKCK